MTSHSAKIDIFVSTRIEIKKTVEKECVVRDSQQYQSFVHRYSLPRELESALRETAEERVLVVEAVARSEGPAKLCHSV